jgi:uncharacterized protein HemX
LSDEQTSANAQSPKQATDHSAVVAGSRQHRAEREEEDPQARFARRTANATVAIAALAIVAALIGGLQYCSMQGQLKAMRNQTLAMLRPWVIIKKATATANVEKLTITLDLQLLGQSPPANLEFSVFALAVVPKPA